VYSVISVIDKRLPGNTKKWTLAWSWLIRVRLVHSFEATPWHWRSCIGGKKFRRYFPKKKSFFLKRFREASPKGVLMEGRSVDTSAAGTVAIRSAPSLPSLARERCRCKEANAQPFARYRVGLTFWLGRSALQSCHTYNRVISHIPLHEYIKHTFVCIYVYRQTYIHPWIISKGKPF